MRDLSPAKTDLETIEIASRDEISSLQLDRLKWSLRHAYDNVPMYRQRFDAAGVHPDDLKDLTDLAKFPFTYKNDLRDNYPSACSPCPVEKLVRIHASSGTTGKPTVVGLYQERHRRLGDDAGAQSCGLRAAGAGHRPQRLRLRALHRRPRRALRRRESWAATVVPMGGGMTEQQVSLIDDFQPTASW